jgi:hypothetical protein
VFINTIRNCNSKAYQKFLSHKQEEQVKLSAGQDDALELTDADLEAVQGGVGGGPGGGGHGGGGHGGGVPGGSGGAPGGSGGAPGGTGGGLQQLFGLAPLGGLPLGALGH